MCYVAIALCNCMFATLSFLKSRVLHTSNTNIFFHENVFENAFWKMAAILFRPQDVNNICPRVKRLFLIFGERCLWRNHQLSTAELLWHVWKSYQSLHHNLDNSKIKFALNTNHARKFAGKMGLNTCSSYSSQMCTDHFICIQFSLGSKCMLQPLC